MIMNLENGNTKQQPKGGKFIRQKCYIEEIDDKIKITCAGMPSSCYDFVTWKNFKTGFKCRWKISF